MSSQPEHAHQQHQHGRPVFNVVVQFAGHSPQAQQPDDFQRAEQAADALGEEEQSQGWEPKTPLLQVPSPPPYRAAFVSAVYFQEMQYYATLKKLF